MQSRRVLAVALAAALALLWAPAASAAGAAGAAPDGKVGAADAGETLSYAKFVKASEKQSGLFTLYRKDAKVYLELKPDQLGHDYLEHAVTVNGLGGYGVLSGDDFAQEVRLVHFVRTDAKHVAIVWPQIRFLALDGSALAAAVRGSTADSTQGVAPVVAEDHDTKAVVVDMSVLLADNLNLANTLSDAVHDPKNPEGSYRLDAERSYFGAFKALPKNVVIEADQTFASRRSHGINTVVEPRAIQLRVKYNFAEILGSPDYVPRLADERVGYFSDPHIGFDNDEREDNRVRYVLRWNIKPSDPAKALSPAAKPIVYTISNTVPEQYRPAIRAAVLEWNKAFEALGISDAVKVQDQPADPDFDPDDIRYNVIRWLTEANGGGFAEAQVEWDPRTGEIFRGGVLIDADIARLGKFLYADLAQPLQTGAGDPTDLWDPAAADPAAYATPRNHRETSIDGGETLHAQAQFGALALSLMDGSVPPDYSFDFMKAIVLHEIGHDFGLQHNFLGHDAYTAEELKDKAFTDRFGVTSSVMEYAPINLWPKGRSHGDLFAPTIGTYDYHAIHWGYAPVPGARTPDGERATLDRWAGSAVYPKYAFASDEDVQYNGHAVDPRVAQFQLTNDPIAWCETQLDLERGLLRTLDTRFPRPGEPWEQERAAFGVLLRQYNRCSGAMTHYIAGEYLTRGRRGDPGSPIPLVPVPRDIEARAYRDLDRYLFAASAWQFSPDTLRRLVYSEYTSFSDFGYEPTPRHDISVSELVGTFQNRALAYMFSPLVLQRLADLPSKAGTVKTMTLADLFDWTRASVYGDLRSGAPPQTQLRRNLQRNYTRLLARLTVAPYPGTPYDAQALARYELRSLAVDLHGLQRRSNLDEQARAHLDALQNDIARALDAKLLLPATPAAPE
jgi:hypothetical protein